MNSQQANKIGYPVANIRLADLDTLTVEIEGKEALQFSLADTSIYELIDQVYDRGYQYSLCPRLQRLVLELADQPALEAIR